MTKPLFGQKWADLHNLYNYSSVSDFMKSILCLYNYVIQDIIRVKIQFNGKHYWKIMRKQSVVGLLFEAL